MASGGYSVAAVISACVARLPSSSFKCAMVTVTGVLHTTSVTRAPLLDLALCVSSTGPVGVGPSPSG